MSLHAAINQNTAIAAPPDQKVDQDILLVLRRLCERGSVLAVARDMETAVVVREDGEGQSIRTAVVDRDIAQAIAVREWIKTDNPDARITRYVITTDGQKAVQELTAEAENRAQALDVVDISNNGKRKRSRAPAARSSFVESPIMGLARRKDKDGTPFLSKDLVLAGERLRQDFEISDLDVSDCEECREFLRDQPPHTHDGIQAARERLVAALDELGAGLREIAMECCCFCHGLELTEAKMGWSARSGKIVLRIALIRLQNHYKVAQGKYAPMIG